MRQCCPLSPLLFSWNLQPFSLSVARCVTVHGFKLHSTEVKLLSYEDGVVVFCTNMESASKVEFSTKFFCEEPGTTVNWQKSSGIWFAAWDDMPEVFEGKQWERRLCNYLGVPLQYHCNSTGYWSNFAVKLLHDSLKWARSYLSIIASARVCNACFVLKLFYVTMILHCSRANI